MKLNTFKRYNKEDYSGATDWFLTFLDNINTTIDSLNPLITHNIDIDNNLLAERQIVTLSHGVPIRIKLRSLRIRPTLVRVGYAAGFVGVGAITAYNTDGTISVTVFFLGTPPSVPVLTTLVLEP